MVDTYDAKAAGCTASAFEAQSHGSKNGRRPSSDSAGEAKSDCMLQECCRDQNGRRPSSDSAGKATNGCMLQECCRHQNGHSSLGSSGKGLQNAAEHLGACAGASATGKAGTQKVHRHSLARLPLMAYKEPRLERAYTLWHARHRWQVSALSLVVRCADHDEFKSGAGAELNVLVVLLLVHQANARTDGVISCALEKSAPDRQFVAEMLQRRDDLGRQHGCGSLRENVIFYCCAGGCGWVCHYDIPLSALCSSILRAGSGALARRSARQLPACTASAHHGPFPALVRIQTLSSSSTAMLLLFRVHPWTWQE